MGNEKSKSKNNYNPREEHKARLQNNQSLQNHQSEHLRTSFADTWEARQRNRSFDGVPSNSNKENDHRSSEDHRPSTLALRRGDSFLVEYLMSTLIYEEDLETITAKYILQHLQERKARNLLNIQQIELKLTQYEVLLHDAATKERQDFLQLERMEACHHITGSKIFNSLLLLVMIVPSNSRQRLIYMFQCSTVPAEIVADKLNVAKAKIPIRYSQESDRGFEPRRVTAAQPINNGIRSHPSQVGIAASQSISPIPNYYALHSNTTPPAESFTTRLPVSASSSSVETIPVQTVQPPQPPSTVQNSQPNQNENQEETSSLLKGLIEAVKANSEQMKQIRAQTTNIDTLKDANSTITKDGLQGTTSEDENDHDSSSNKNESEDEREKPLPEPQITKVKSEPSSTPKSTPKSSKKSKKHYALKGKHLEDDDRYSMTSEESNRFSASRDELDQFRQKIPLSSSPSVVDTISSRIQEQNLNDYTNSLLSAQQQVDLQDAQLQLWHQSLLQRQQEQNDYQALLQEAAVSQQQQIEQVALQQATVIQQLRDQVLLQQDALVQHQQQEEIALQTAAALKQQQEFQLLLQQQREQQEYQLQQAMAAEQQKQQQTALLQTLLLQQQKITNLQNLVEKQSEINHHQEGNQSFINNADATLSPQVNGQNPSANVLINPSVVGQDQVLSLLLQQQTLNQNPQNQVNQLNNNNLQNLLLLQQLQLNGQQQF